MISLIVRHPIFIDGFNVDLLSLLTRVDDVDGLMLSDCIELLTGNPIAFESHLFLLDTKRFV